MARRQAEPAPISLEDLTREEREVAIVHLVAEKEQVYTDHPWPWMEEIVQTQDEATQQKLRWPADKPRLKDMIYAIHEENLIAIPKSRRLFVTWAVAAYCTWRVRYHPFNLVLYQSKTEGDAAFVIDKRCKFIEDNLVIPCFRRDYDSWKTKEGDIGKIKYRMTGSELIAVPQGGDVVRSYTFSILVGDEIEFQPESEEAYTAAIPIVEKGAKFILMSSSNGPGGVLAGICREVGFSRWT